ncbi:MAG: SpoIVB peptidase S55 domain-containing protein [Polyangiaceae bacterium]
MRPEGPWSFLGIELARLSGLFYSVRLTVRATCSLLVLALLGLSALLPDAVEKARAASARTRGDILPLSAIQPKMKGYGLTVFEGTRPERFDIEVIDVLRRFMPKQDLILIKTHHPRLDVAKVVAGMSGSPIYIDGKMIGAYAYGWTFAREAIAGVTPIENMIADIDRPIPSEIYGWSLGLRGATSSRREARSAAAFDGESRGRSSGTAERYSLAAHAEAVASNRAVSHDAPTLRQVSTPLLLGGVSPLGTQIAEKLLGPLGFEPMQAGGDGGTARSSSANGATTARYEDGSAIGVQLVRGDTSAMGLGTVTRVEGDRLVAFGHPMMQAGATALPTSLAKVLWFLASEQRSFKIGMPIEPLGALVADSTGEHRRVPRRCGAGHSGASRD